MAINPANQVTRMGMAGAMWQPHGSYDGKVPGAVVTPNENQIEPRDGGAIGWSRQKKRRKEQEILKDDKEFMKMIQAALPEILKYLGR